MEHHPHFPTSPPSHDSFWEGLEDRRQEIADDAKQTLEDYRQGEFKAQTVDKVINDLMTKDYPFDSEKRIDIGG